MQAISPDNIRSYEREQHFKSEDAINISSYLSHNIINVPLLINYLVGEQGMFNIPPPPKKKKNSIESEILHNSTKD